MAESEFLGRRGPGPNRPWAGHTTLAVLRSQKAQSWPPTPTQPPAEQMT